MKNKAADARRARLDAAQRLIEQHSAPPTAPAKKAKATHRRMVQPVQVKVVTA